MPDLRTLVAQADPGTAPNVVRAVVVRPPADVDSELAVIVPSFADDRLYEVRFWAARGDVLPETSDEAVLVFTETGEPWMVAFWSADGNTQTTGGGGGGGPPFAANVGDGASTTITITHSLGTYDLEPTLLEPGASHRRVFTDIRFPTVNTAELVFAGAPAVDQYRLILAPTP